MFSKAKVKRFNEEAGCAPAPNAYDAKVAATNAGASMCTKSSRFVDPKYVTPGPGQYVVPSSSMNLKAQASGSKLVRSASFRLKKVSTTDLARGSSSSDIFRTPSTCTTPRMLRKSTSSSDLTFSPSKQHQEIETYKNEIDQLEREVAQLKERLQEKESYTDNGRDKFESLEAELETCKAELKYRSQLVEDLLEEKENLLKRSDCVAEKEDRIDVLKFEVELLNEDNFNMEKEIQSLQQEREQSEEKLRDLEKIREDLERKYEEEDAKKGFLAFTQEQMNLQIESLDHVVNSLRAENHLLSRGINKMVRAVQQEKSLLQAEKEKLREVTETYTAENAESELEFKRVQDDLAALNRENARLQENLLEATKDAEVHENDKSALKQALATLEAEKNGLAMDLGLIVKNKEEVNKELEISSTKISELERELEEVRSEIHELEMSKLGLEGTLASVREELGQAENNLQVLEVDNWNKDGQISSLRSRESELENLLAQNKDIIRKHEEMTTLLRDNESSLNDKLSTKQSQIDELTSLVKEGCEDNARMIEKASELSKQLTEATEVIDIQRSEVTSLKQELSSQIDAIELRIKTMEVSEVQKQQEIEVLQCKLNSESQALYEEKALRLRTEEELSNKENEVVELTARATELKLNREEVEESLLDTQELVECMEKKLQDAYKEYKSETDKLSADFRQVTTNLDDVKLERTKLIDINTDLSNQVTESLHAIANLQERERMLGSRCQEYELQIEVNSDELEDARGLTSRMEQEMTGMQSELETCLGEIGAMEAERIQLKETLNVVLEQLEDAKDDLRQKNGELIESKTVGRQLLGRIQELESQATKMEEEINKWKQRTCDREQEVTIVQDEVTMLHDKVGHLEKVRDNLERSLLEKSDQVKDLKTESLKLSADNEELKNQKQADKEKHEEIIKSNHRLKGNLELYQKELTTARTKEEQLTNQLQAAEQESLVKLNEKCEQMDVLNSQLKEKATELKSLEEKILTKEKRIQNLEIDRQEKEDIRMREMNIMINLRTELEAKEAEMADLNDKLTSNSQVLESANEDKKALTEAQQKIVELESAIKKWEEKLSDADSVMKMMEEKLEEEESRNRALELMIEPFKDQLESFELEKNSLLSENAQAHDEVKKLATQYGQLLGHQNQKQKIQHVVKIKQENVELKTEINNLRKQVAKQKQTIVKLEDKVNEAHGVKRFDPRMSFQTPIRNKENMTLGKETPMGPPKLGFRGRSVSSVSLGSPLRDKNH